MQTQTQTKKKLSIKTFQVLKKRIHYQHLFQNVVSKRN